MEIRDVSNVLEFQEEVEEELTRYVKSLGIMTQQASYAKEIREDGKIIAGISGSSTGNTFYIHSIHVAENFRQKGYGTSLIKDAEKNAKNRGCQKIQVQTLSVMAIDYYKKLGYSVLAVVKDSPQLGVDRYYFIKSF